MPYAQIETIATGSTDTFSVPFEYASQSHVKVYLNGVLLAASSGYTWLDSGTIKLASVPSAGTKVLRKRETYQAGMLSVQSPSVYSHNDANNADKQLLLLAQELDDFAKAAVLAGSGIDIQYDATKGVYTITNIGVPNGGSGNVVGPASSVNNRVAVFSGTTGKLIADSGVTMVGGSIGIGPATTLLATLDISSNDGANEGGEIRLRGAPNGTRDFVVDVNGSILRIFNVDKATNNNAITSFEVSQTAVRSPSYQLGNLANCYVGADIGTGYPGINFDSSDYIDFARALNIMRWSIGIERMRMLGGGQLLLGDVATHWDGSKFNVSSAVDGNNLNIVTLVSGGTGATNHVIFRNGNGVAGSIVTNGSGTAYNTASDYRLKENVRPIEDAIARLKSLSAHRFNFKSEPGKTVDGFIAHEAAAVIPESVTGAKDALDADGNPVYQGIDQAKLVPLLWAALQEAVARIEALEGANQ
jgi:hypothetical protein